MFWPAPLDLLGAPRGNLWTYYECCPSIHGIDQTNLDIHAIFPFSLLIFHFNFSNLIQLKLFLWHFWLKIHYFLNYFLEIIIFWDLFQNILTVWNILFPLTCDFGDDWATVQLRLKLDMENGRKWKSAHSLDFSFAFGQTMGTGEDEKPAGLFWLFDVVLFCLAF